MLCSQCDNANHNTIVTKLHYALKMRLHSKKRRHKKKHGKPKQKETSTGFGI